MSKRSRGFTLIELMIACAILGIGGTVTVEGFMGYLKATKRARALEATAHILDSEMERLSACSAYCARDQAVSSQWPYPAIRTRRRGGPDGLVEVTLSARIEGVREPRELVALVGGQR